MNEITKVEGRTVSRGRRIREFILSLESKMYEMPDALVGDSCPLEHTFAEGMYVRQITMPKGMIFVTKIHKFSHPAFILKGEVSILEESGPRRVMAPAAFITPAGTKRIVYTHEETVWTTVHLNPNNHRDIDKIEGEIIATSFDEIEMVIEVQMEVEK
jgi:quercetin dioxygenase-like cupin family protein